MYIFDIDVGRIIGVLFSIIWTIMILRFITLAIGKAVSRDSAQKTVINGKTIEIKSIKLPFFNNSDDSLSSEFNGKSSKEDSNPFEV